MVLLQDGLLAFFSAVGLTTVVWLAGGALLRGGRNNLPGLLLVLPLRGEALAMESDVRELRRLNTQDCMGCGCCDYVCPAHIPLVARMRQAWQIVTCAEKDGEVTP